MVDEQGFSLNTGSVLQDFPGRALIYVKKFIRRQYPRVPSPV